MRPVIHHPEATAEIGEAARYYEQRVTGLGAQFLDEIDEAVKTIRALPECWPVIAAAFAATCSGGSRLDSTTGSRMIGSRSWRANTTVGIPTTGGADWSERSRRPNLRS